MFGISLLPIIPLREEPNSQSEMVSQLLFGEKYKVLHQQPSWVKIETIDDHYIGWVNEKQVNIIDGKEWQNLLNPMVVMDYPHLKIMVNKLPMFIATGSQIYLKENFKISSFEFDFEYNNIDLSLEQIAKQYLNSPYLWGGKSPWGIDCSGFTQMVFRQKNVMLKRDAYQQAEQGELLVFLAEANLGDLAFFDNEEGKITHVGILLNNETIIHASGKVRIDQIDNYGIMNSESKKYSHKLRFIKRFKFE
ncbi:MAG: NlpC/P60 family protein [Bacteroidia bacterium]